MATFPSTGVSIECAPEIIEFFSASYGESFVGDERFFEDYIQKADEIVLCEHDVAISAVALLRATRITAIGTNPNELQVGQRTKNLAELLDKTKKVSPMSWITIGERYSRLQRGVTIAGMEPITDKGYLKDKLNLFGELDLHEVRQDENYLLVRKLDSVHGLSYWQQAWGWIPESSNI